MPFLPTNNLLSEEEKKKQQEQGNNLISGEGGNTFSLGLPTTAPTKPGGPKQSGSFTNLNSYLDANKEQSNQLGSDVSNKITDVGNQARNQFGVSKDQFGQKVNAGTIQNIDSAVGDASNTVNKAYTLGAGNNFNQDELSRFKEVTNAQYKGPNKIEDESDVYNPANELNSKVNQYSKLSETDDGRGQLLSEIYKRPTYSQGQVTFDNLLLGGNQQSKQKLSDARNQVADVKDLFSGLVQDSNSLVGSVKNKTDDVRNQAQAFTNQNQVQRNQQVESRLGEVNNNWDNEYNSLLKTFNDSDGGKNLSLTPEQMARLSVNEQQQIFTMLKDNDGSNYLRKNAFDASRVISKDEQAQLSALDMLANQYYGNQLNKYTNPDIAGSMTIADAVDGSKFGDEATKRQNLFNQIAKDTTLTGYGTDKETYQYGIGNMSNGEVTRSAELRQNIADFLKGYDPSSSSDSINKRDLVKDVMVNYNPALNLEFAKQLGIDLGGITGGNSSGAERDALRNAYNIAQSSLFSQIEEFLNNQGYANQIKKKG